MLAVVEHSGQLVDVLVQGSAERDVHFLKSPAHCEERNRAFDAAAHERQGGLVPVRVVQRSVPAGRLAVVAGQHVRRASGEQKAVDRVEQIVVGDGTPECRDEERERTRRRTHRGGVLLLDDVMNAAFDVAPARGDTDNGSAHEASLVFALGQRRS